MKFLCVLCDEPMKLIETAPPDRGSLSLVYECPQCAHRIAMLTNPYETQVVGSLGVKVGPAAEGESAGCPFSDVVAGMTAPAGAGEMVWTGPALERLTRIPEFVRPMAKTGIEKYARDNGYGQVNEEVVDHAKDFFGM